MKHNKPLKISAFILLTLSISIILYLFTTFLKNKKNVQTLDTMLKFTVVDIKGKVVASQDITDKNKILVYFDPTCEFCQAEMETLSKKNKFHKEAVVFPLPDLNFLLCF